MRLCFKILKIDRLAKQCVCGGGGRVGVSVDFVLRPGHTMAMCGRSVNLTTRQ